MTIDPRVFELTHPEPELEPVVVPPAGPPYLLRSSPLINLITPAIAGAHCLIEFTKQSSINPQFKSHYSTLTDALSVLKDPLKEFKLFNTFSIQSGPDTISGCLIVTHISGQWIASNDLTLPLAKKDIHGYKSANTYLRRILLENYWALTNEDDDGNASLNTSAPRGDLQDEITMEKRLDNISRCSSNTMLDSYFTSLPEALKKLPLIVDACKRRRAELEAAQ